jgi:NTE family protein
MVSIARFDWKGADAVSILLCIATTDLPMIVSAGKTITRVPVGLALQGGGSWGAYTWGVLDALLASRRLSIGELSGTSAGALNGAIVAGALARGSRKRAREALRAFWLDVAYPAHSTPGGEIWAPVERAWRESVSAWMLSGATAPHQLNPLGLNPLRTLIERHVDIEAVQSASAPRLYVTLTNVRTACLPQLFQAIEIDGEPYWDGGFSGNPTLWPMIEGRATRDLIVVQLVPEHVADAPTDGNGIRRRVGEIVFNSSLVAEIASIRALRALAAASDSDTGVALTRLHRIGPPPPALLTVGSALERSRAWLEKLFDEGRKAAQRFITRHGRNVGVNETLDITRAFAGEPRATSERPANEDSFERRIRLGR